MLVDSFTKLMAIKGYSGLELDYQTGVGEVSKVGRTIQ